MRINLTRPDTWVRASEAFRAAAIQEFSLGSASFSPQLLRSTREAVWEFGQALTQLFPTKKTVVYYKNGGPEFEPLATDLARQGFAIKPVTLDELRLPQEWLEPIIKDVLFICINVDDPITGELIDYGLLFDYLKDKRLVRFLVSHQAHRWVVPPAPHFYDLRFLSLGPQKTLALLGERARVTPNLSASLDWPVSTFAEACTELHVTAIDQMKKNQQVIEALEANLPKAIKPVLQTKNRLWDRAVLEVSGVDGAAFIALLAERLQGQLTGLRSPERVALEGEILSSVGGDSDFEATSLCRWNSDRAHDWSSLWDSGYAKQSVVLLSARVCALDRIATVIAKAYADLLAMQELV